VTKYVPTGTLFSRYSPELFVVVEWAALIFAVAAVFVLRRKMAGAPRPFRTPGYPMVPALYLVGTGLLTAAVFYERWQVATYSLLSILAGIPVYFLWASRGEPKATDGV